MIIGKIFQDNAAQLAAYGCIGLEPIWVWGRERLDLKWGQVQCVKEKKERRF